MAVSPSSDKQARMVLEAFRHFKRGPGEVLLPGRLLSVAVQRGWQPQDMEDGVALGISLGWFERADNKAIRLTAAGFAEL